MGVGSSESVGAGASRPATLLVALVVGGALVVVAAVGGATAGVAVTALSGAALGVATLCRAREGPLWTAAAALLVPVVALGAVAGLGLVASGRGAVGAALSGTPVAALAPVALALGVGAAALGATSTLGDGFGEGAVRRVHRVAVANGTVVGVAFGVVGATRIGALDALPSPEVNVGALLDPVLAPSNPTVSLVSFPLLVVAAALACRAAVSTLPVAELAARRKRAAVEARLDRLDAALGRTVAYGVIAAAAGLLSVIPLVRATLPVTPVATLLAHPALRWSLLYLLVIAASAALAGKLLRAAAGSTARTVGRVLPVTAGGVGIVTVAAVAGDPLVAAVASALPPSARPLVRNLTDALSPAGVVLGATTAALTGLTLLLLALVVLSAVDLVPTKAGGGALAGGGVGLCAVVLGVGSAPALATFALVGLGVVAWDASEQGATARADLGPRSATRIEAIHAVGSVGVAVVGVGIAWLVRGLVGRVALPDGALVGAVAAVTGAVLLLGVLRG